jgi:hypothetical protein
MFIFMFGLILTYNNQWIALAIVLAALIIKESKK